MRKWELIVYLRFRWDYYERQKSQLPGLTQLISNGVQAQWVEPIFPSLSFPSWTTIATGLYPENHNVLGNYMLHLGEEELPETVFHLKDNSTMLPLWWDSAEPIWITATKNYKKVFMANWARCEVPFEGILPAECTGYTYQSINTRFRDDLNTAVKRLKNGFSLAMVVLNNILIVLLINKRILFYLIKILTYISRFMMILLTTLDINLVPIRMS